MKPPLAIFAFNRPHKLRQVLQAVAGQTIKPSEIIGFSDGARSPADADAINGCYDVLNKNGARLIVRHSNLGCATNIMTGVNWMAQHFQQFVVLEDDTLPASVWYESMCVLLDRYADDPKVGAVGGYPSILPGALRNHPDVIMSPRFSCWGWGTWGNKWPIIFKEWEHYKQFGRPPYDVSTLPGIAGLDIPSMIQNCAPGSLWDAVVAGTFLHHGLVQAITKYYLVHNIGLDVYMDQHAANMVYSRNIIEERVPVKMPDSIYVPEVGDAVRAYVNHAG